jgi:hypothetical protein
VQSVVTTPAAVTRECLPSHVAAALGTQVLAALHVKLAAQSASVAHEVAQTSPLHWYGEHGIPTAAAHVPVPVHDPARVAMPALHDAARQDVVDPAKPLHVSRVAPSHASARQTSADEVAGHGERPCAGGPRTAWHMPGDAASAHASHCPVHAVLQHTPSAQNVDAHSAPAAHASPFPFVQTPAALQLFCPLQLSGSGASVIFAHTPRLPTTLHAWHVPQSGASQHTPSTQNPDAHVEPSVHD